MNFSIAAHGRQLERMAGPCAVSPYLWPPRSRPFGRFPAQTPRICLGIGSGTFYDPIKGGSFRETMEAIRRFLLEYVVTNTLIGERTISSA